MADEAEGRASRALIASRLDQIAYGHAGDVSRVGRGISELRIDYGPGYRIYFQQRGYTLIILLCGGDKGSQTRAFRMAQRLAEEVGLEDEDEADGL